MSSTFVPKVWVCLSSSAAPVCCGPRAAGDLWLSPSPLPSWSVIIVGALEPSESQRSGEWGDIRVVNLNSLPRYPVGLASVGDDAVKHVSHCMS